MVKKIDLTLVVSLSLVIFLLMYVAVAPLIKPQADTQIPTLISFEASYKSNSQKIPEIFNNNINTYNKFLNDGYVKVVGDEAQNKISIKINTLNYNFNLADGINEDWQYEVSSSYQTNLNYCKTNKCTINAVNSDSTISIPVIFTKKDNAINFLLPANNLTYTEFFTLPDQIVTFKNY